MLCCQVAAGVPDVFCNFYLALITQHESIEDREKIAAVLVNLEVYKIFDVDLTKFKNKQVFVQWKGINRKQSTRWQHLSRLKASAFFSLQNFF